MSRKYFQYFFRAKSYEMNWGLIFAMVIFYIPLSQPISAAPGILEELKRMSPAQQRALAEQYQVDPALLENAPSPEFEIGSPGLPLETEEIEEEVVRENLELDEVESLERFGSRVFDKEVSTFAPVDNFPVPEGYLLGPGDSLNIMLFGKEQLSQVLEIDREGAVSFPRLGPISMAGLGFREAKRMIEKRVSQQMIGTEAVVSMGRLRSINVFLAGEVKTPGSYSISALSTLTQAIYLGGGVGDIGSLRDIQVHRGGAVINRFDVYDLMLKGEAGGDIRLHSGDVLFVPTVGSLVKVDGEVLRPREYELRGVQSIGEIIEMAGGVLNRGYKQNIRIERYSPGTSLPEILSVDMSNPGWKDLQLQDGDYISVDRVANHVANPVELKGSVARPGLYGWSEGSRFSDYVTDLEADLLPTTDTSVGLIIRRRDSSRDIEVVSFDVVAALDNKRGDADPLIRIHDQIMLFELPVFDELSRENLLRPVINQLRAQASIDETVEIVGVGGAVRLPGYYPLLNRGSIRALIKLAGGLVDSAYITDVEIRRVVSVSGESSQVDLVNVSLESVIRDDADIVLQGRDFVRINQVPDWNPQASVLVMGEVTFPGEYLVAPGEALSSVVARAGGMTDQGFAGGAIFTRESIKEAERQHLKNVSNDILRSRAARLLTSENTEMSNLGTTDLEPLMRIESLGRLVIDLPSILSGDLAADIQLQDGDSLSIPRKTDTVTVVGEVQRAGSYHYREELTAKDYLTLAAGLTPRADKGGVYVIKANGEVRYPRLKVVSTRWITGRGRGSERSNVDIGDTFVVPINQQYRPVLSRYSEITTVVFQSVASVAALLAL